MTDDPFKNFVESPDNYARYEYHLFRNCLIPMMEDWGIKFDNASVIDLGCGSGGGTLAIAKKGAKCLGIDRNIERITTARNLTQGTDLQINFKQKDILSLENFEHKFDLILLIEVLEHLSNLNNVETLLTWCRSHLKPHGLIFISFPPWYNPFAGHQAGWPVIRYIPWYHLLPKSIKLFLAPNHAPRYLNFSNELNKLTIKSFERITKNVGLFIQNKSLYHIRPEYQWRYGIRPLRSITNYFSLEYINELTTTGAYYTLSIDRI